MVITGLLTYLFRRGVFTTFFVLNQLPQTRRFYTVWCKKIKQKLKDKPQGLFHYCG